MNKLLGGIKNIFLKEPVAVISFLLALITVFIIPVDKGYLEYISFETIGLLATLMIIMAGLSGIGFFASVASALLGKIKNIRVLGLVCVMLCFFFSMVITNDVALITFVPFTIEVFTMADKKKYLIPVITLQTIAANLGSILTPIGNPHNLYLYELSGMNIGSFLALMLPHTVFAFVILLVSIWIVIKKEKVKTSINLNNNKGFQKKSIGKLMVYLGLFVLGILVVLHVCPVYLALIITVITALVIDKKAVLKVDYGLLLTFVFLFIFIGCNGGRQRIHHVRHPKPGNKRCANGSFALSHD